MIYLPVQATDVPPGGTDHLEERDKYDALTVLRSYRNCQALAEAERVRLRYVLHSLSQTYSLRVIAKDLGLHLNTVQRMVKAYNGSPSRKAAS